jgi:hypothetical protein
MTACRSYGGEIHSGIWNPAEDGWSWVLADWHPNLKAARSAVEENLARTIFEDHPEMSMMDAIRIAKKPSEVWIPRSTVRRIGDMYCAANDGRQSSSGTRCLGGSAHR